MNRRQKIILSLTVIGIVLLILIGITYAYFLTRITGNTNTKSISVSTANLALVYGDGNGIIEPDEEIIPGTTIDSKTFTVTNEGNDTTEYVVVIEDVVITNASTEETTTFESNDFVYTLTCKSYENFGEDTQAESGTCSGADTQVTFPITGGILTGNSVEVGKTHSYTLTVTYKDTGIDQSNDMNKTLTAKVNIKDPNGFNPYVGDKGSLAYTIINNAVTVTAAEKEAGYAELVDVAPTKVAQEISGETESILSTTADEYGTSYYYRGNVENNYINFNGMCWRIVRIEGDGAVKIVLADAAAECTTATQAKTDSAYIGTGDYGYTDDNKADYENSANRTSSMKYKFNIFLNGGSFTYEYFDENWSLATATKTYTAWSTEAKSKLKSEEVCIGDTTTLYDIDGNILTETSNSYYYESYVRLRGKGQTANATLLCNAIAGKTSPTQIFPLTADEVVFAGGIFQTDNLTYYLRDNATTEFWWTLSPSDFGDGSDSAFYVNENGDVGCGNNVHNGYFNLRPAVSLVSGTQFDSGDGSINAPYKIK